MVDDIRDVVGNYHNKNSECPPKTRTKMSEEQGIYQSAQTMHILTIKGVESPQRRVSQAEKEFDTSDIPNSRNRKPS
ncbi:hypothetical protein RB195_003618 [Necator americanus]|uniref:Uncharacterized protein n=1 Tax=Necator americanus TaxID=51031 RepID=A0ABR1DPE9_NECAM